jgi:hypothetical protein
VGLARELEANTQDEMSWRRVHRELFKLGTQALIVLNGKLSAVPGVESRRARTKCGTVNAGADEKIAAPGCCASCHVVDDVVMERGHSVDRWGKTRRHDVSIFEARGPSQLS